MCGTLPQLLRRSRYSAYALEGLGHPQQRTEVITDNSTANSFVHSEMRVKQSKSWDMRYNWLRDRSAQQHFKLRWDKGIYNLADYFTKHHSPNHHRIKRYDYILKGFKITFLNVYKKNKKNQIYIHITKGKQIIS